MLLISIETNKTTAVLSVPSLSADSETSQFPYIIFYLFQTMISLYCIYPNIPVYAFPPRTGLFSINRINISTSNILQHNKVIPGERRAASPDVVATWTEVCVFCPHFRHDTAPPQLAAALCGGHHAAAPHGEPPQRRRRKM